MTSEASVEDRFKVTKFRPKTVTGAEDHRPLIRITTGNLEEVVDQAEVALMASGRGLYQRADRIVSVGEAKRVTADKREVLVTRILERGEHALNEDVTVAARFEKFDGRSNAYVLTDPPSKVIRTLRERTGRLRFPPLEGIVNAPTLRPDGSLLDEPEYDEATGLLFKQSQTVFPQILDRPSRQDAEEALELIGNLISSFPFVGEADRSVALSALLTAPIRRSLPSAPLHGFTAPVAGSGKSMFVDIASVLATGREAAVIAQGSTEEEFEKRLGSILLTGDLFASIDNCERPLGGDFLCQALTQPSVRVRILGRSEAPELPTGVFVAATGNNLMVAGDMTRRTLLCSLDPKEEQPELRKFDRNPIVDAKLGRGTYVAAVLTILRAYIVAGRPKQVDPLGSFKEWSDLVRSSLIWLGCKDPVATMEAARARDPRLDELQNVMAQWLTEIGEERTTTQNVIAKAVEKPASSSFDYNTAPGFKRPDLREALLAVAGYGGAINNRSLGRWIGKNKDRIVTITKEASEDTTPKTVAQYRFISEPKLNGNATWRLQKVRTVAPV